MESKNKHKEVARELKDRFFSATGKEIFKLTGNSMLPYLKENDEVLTVKLKLSNINRGDIIVFSDARNLVAHRVIYKKEEEILIKGDNRITIDHNIDLTKGIKKAIKITRKDTVIDLSSRNGILTNEMLTFISYFELITVGKLHKIINTNSANSITDLCFRILRTPRYVSALLILLFIKKNKI